MSPLHRPGAARSPRLRCLLRLLESGRVWVKLSAPYESSRAGPPRYEDVGGLAQAWSAPRPSACSGPPTGPTPATGPGRFATMPTYSTSCSTGPPKATRSRIPVSLAALYGF